MSETGNSGQNWSFSNAATPQPDREAGSYSTFEERFAGFAAI